MFSLVSGVSDVFWAESGESANGLFSITRGYTRNNVPYENEEVLEMKSELFKLRREIPGTFIVWIILLSIV